jgi:predicted acylesterase/phospholipase RssA
VGALRALLERGVIPDVIVGTSIGAWNGAWLAKDPTLGGVEALAEIWRGLRAEQLLLGYESFRAPTQSIAGILVAMGAAPRLMMGYPSFYTDVGLRRLVRRCVGDMTFADLKATLRIVATDLTHGVRAVFSEGPLEAPILASSAIPAVFPPVRIGDSVYADGCALDGCSIETALSLGARRLFVLSVGYDESEEDGAYWSRTLAPMAPTPHALQAPNPAAPSNGRNHAPQDAMHSTHANSHGMAAIFERITQVMGYYQLSQALAHIPRGVETHVIQLPSRHAGGMLDFDVAGKWMDDAYAFTRDSLDRDHVGASAEPPADGDATPTIAAALAS